MVKYDAPLSVLRAFKKQELIEILNKAGIRDYAIRWQWAFRWQVIVRVRGHRAIFLNVLATLILWRQFFVLLQLHPALDTNMKIVHSFFLSFYALLFASCASGPLGQKVNEPFRGNAYESNNRFFRGTGKGVSSQDNIARGKADIEAKAQLAGQVNTTMKQVADQYLGQTENEKAADVADKFQSLVRQVMNTNMADLRKMGEEKYFNEKTNEYRFSLLMK